MSRKIEWNPNHKSPGEPEDSFIDEFLTWSPKKKWDYLMELASQGIKKSRKNSGKRERKIEWK